MFAVVLALGSFCGWSSEGYFIPGVRPIAIPPRGSDYHRFESQVIDTQAKLTAFLKPFNRKNEFERGGR
jgi:hypothetical protein